MGILRYLAQFFLGLALRHMDCESPSILEAPRSFLWPVGRGEPATFNAGSIATLSFLLQWSRDSLPGSYTDNQATWKRLDLARKF